MRAALTAASRSLRWEFSLWDALGALAELRLPPRVISRVAFAATKADHVADRQRGNLAALMRSLTEMPNSAVKAGHFAIASVRCTEDFVWTLEGRPVSAVRGRVLGHQVMTRSYPGEVPDRPPDADFWAHPFLALPAFEPMRLPEGGRMGVPNIGLDALLGFLLEDVL
jgi:predicted YcjX-like family ATPase